MKSLFRCSSFQSRKDRNLQDLSLIGTKNYRIQPLHSKMSASILSLVLLFLTLVNAGPSQLRRRNASVLRLELINAKTGQKHSDLFYGQYVNVSSIDNLTGPEFNIKAVTEGPVDFVRFGYNDNRRYKIEGTEPYAFCGNRRTTFFNCTILGYGTHFVTAQAITNRTPGQLYTVTFTIAEI